MARCAIGTRRRRRRRRMRSCPNDIWFWGPAFLPDSKTFLTVTRHEGAVVRWDAATAQVVERLSFLGTNHLSLDLSTRRSLAGPRRHERERSGVGFPGASARGTNLVFPGASSLRARVLAARQHAGCAAFASAGRPHRHQVLGGGRLARDQPAGHRPQRTFYEPDFSPDERTLAIGYTRRDGGLVGPRDRTAAGSCSTADSAERGARGVLAGRTVVRHGGE